MNESSIFLLQKRGNKYTFSDIPDFIYVDTSFWNESYGTGKKIFRNECHEFLDYCAGNGITLYSSGLVFDELDHIIKQSMVNELVKTNNVQPIKYPDGSINKKDLFERVQAINKNLINDIYTEVNRVIKIIDDKTEFLPIEIDQEFQKDVRELRYKSNYILDTKDAQHALVSRYYGTNSIATGDGDFWVLDNANIFVPPNPKYKMQMLGRKNVYLPMQGEIINDKP